MKKVLFAVIAATMLLTGCGSSGDVNYIIIKDGHYYLGDEVIIFESGSKLKYKGKTVVFASGEFITLPYKSEADLESIKKEHNLK